MAEEASLKKILLKTADDEVFEVEPSIAKEIKTVQSLIDEITTVTSAIPLPNVNGRELARIIEYCRKHRIFRESGAGANDVKKFDTEFAKALSGDEWKELILAVNYLDVKEVLDFLCQGAANFIATKNVEFVREFFHIVNDSTPEEEAELRNQYAWAFEGVDDDEH